MERGILGTVGSPLVQVGAPTGAVIAAKLESKNPGGSAKDRAALAMIEAAERDGDLRSGDRIVEPSSGNTGIGLAMAGAAKGYDVTIVMPASNSPERRRSMAAYGADLELVDGEIERAKERADELEREGMVQLRQFENPANVRAHYETTAVEILDQVGDRTIDALVAAVGTGGTLTGIGGRLREEHPEMDVVAVEPETNAVLSTGEAGADEFEGMGPGFVSDILDIDSIDTIETVGIEAAEAECRRLAREEGILVGQSSGAANVAARRVAEQLARPELDCPPAPTELRADGSGAAATEYDDCPLVVTVFPDSGERYLSTGLFDG